VTEILESLSELIAKSGWLAPLLALVAGVLTSFTPCSLSSIPLVIGYVGGVGRRVDLSIIVNSINWWNFKFNIPSDISRFSEPEVIEAATAGTAA
jgi:hypothetical protein